MIDEITVFESEEVLQFVQSPEAGDYVLTNEAYEEVLYKFDDGNLSHVGSESQEGSYKAFDTHWQFFIDYFYDDLPNPVARLFVHLPEFGKGIKYDLE